MPIPTPRMGKNPESRNDFISRCASDKIMNEDFKDNRQKIAVCFSSWIKKHPEDKKGKEAKSSVDDYYCNLDKDGIEIIDLQKLPEIDIEKLENKE